MINLEEWKKKSPVAANTAFIVAGLLAFYGLIMGTKDAYATVNSMFWSKHLIAVIAGGDFQGKSADDIQIAFTNPTDKTMSVANLGLICKQRNGKTMFMMAANNTAMTMAIVGRMALTPFSIRAGEPVNIDAIFLKLGQPTISQTCASIQPMWTDSEMKTVTGDPVALESGSVTFVNTVLNRR